ncbi:hypothetical protein J2T16_002269 [Paenibacillus intestini]|nr:hypothetical protein [Paenibacillus intestini]
MKKEAPRERPSEEVRLRGHLYRKLPEQMSVGGLKTSLSA